MTQYILAASSLLNFEVILDFFRDLKRRNELNRNIRVTIKELSALTDKELTDIGICRGDIWAIAHEAYYDDLVKTNKNLKGWV